MEVVINIEFEPTLSLQQLASSPYLSTLVFAVIIDQNLEQKLKRILRYMPFLSKYPSVKTQLRVQHKSTALPRVYGTVALGGTFDYLHIGHQILLLYSVIAAKQTVLIGVTGDGLLINKKNKEVLQPLSVRMKQVKRFVKSINPKLNYHIFELNNPFGPTITDENIDCLVASPQTGSSITRINEERLKRQLKPLELVVCPLLSESENVSCKLSSSAIRQYFLKKNNFTSEKLEQYKRYYWNLIHLIDKTFQLKQNKRELAQEWWNKILTCYSESWRFYHTNQHILSIFSEWNSQKYEKTKQSLSPTQIITVQIALFFHDIVYVISSKTNEKDSAVISTKFIQEYLAQIQDKEEISKKVSQLIAETENHIPSNKLSQIVYDLDMGILNTQQLDVYKYYARNIQREFEPIVKDEYSEKRISFLTKTMNEKLHFSFQPVNLKQNLQWQINCLQNFDL